MRAAERGLQGGAAGRSADLGHGTHMGGERGPGHCPVLKEAGGDWGTRADGDDGGDRAAKARAQCSHPPPPGHSQLTADTAPLRTQHRALTFSLRARPL